MTFANIPKHLEAAIATMLESIDIKQLVKRAEVLHYRYMHGDKGDKQSYVHTYSEALAYLALRVPATYAQIFGAFSAVKEISRSTWEPKKLLDIGSGPGTGVWAAHAIWPGLETATCIDVNKDFLLQGNTLVQEMELPVDISWKQHDVTSGIQEVKLYDIVLVANVLNELTVAQRMRLLEQAFDRCKGVVVILEPGTQVGNDIVQAAARQFAKEYMIAPYVQNRFVSDPKTWIHFVQRFNRPEFARRIRQHMRDSQLMASDFEDAKYTYVAIAKLPSADTSWGRVIGPTKIQKGFLEIPILTATGIVQQKVLKRHKTHYQFAKSMRWGQLIARSEDLVYAAS
jgi:ribosomal protein RSM22 (predicted rRNA methylase)